MTPWAGVIPSQLQSYDVAANEPCVTYQITIIVILSDIQIGRSKEVRVALDELATLLGSIVNSRGMGYPA